MKGGNIFEIRVAFIGYVSVGKTTAINALFGAEYGEVSMKRTTAVVNNFRISTPAQLNNGQNEVDLDTHGSVEWSMVVDSPSAPSDSLKQSISDNEKFRNNDIIQEKLCDIVLEDPLHGMRNDTKLVIVDIPGMNEAGTSSKYKEYVEENWHSFDIAVVVMDGRQGVNTEEQLELLKLVKQNNHKVKKIPIIILCNKVDDPEDAEQTLLFKESCRAVEKLFEVTDREEFLAEILKEVASSKTGSPNIGHEDSLIPVVIPVSAMHAFLYRCGGRMSFEEFCNMDKTFIDKIGKESYGRRWRRYDETKKLQKAYEAVSDEEQRKDGVKASNFDTFLSVLGYCIGDFKRQASLIRYQIDVALERISRTENNCELGKELLSAHKKLRALGEKSHSLPSLFWKAYDYKEEKSFDQFDKDGVPTPFANPMHQLSSYLKILPVCGWDEEKEKVVSKAKRFVLRYTLKVLNVMKCSHKSDKDCSLVLGSMLLFSQDWTFCMHFGALKIELETRYMETIAAIRVMGRKCPYCDFAITVHGNGKFLYCESCGRSRVDQWTKFCVDCSTELESDGNYKTCRSCSTSSCVILDPYAWKYHDGRMVPVNQELYQKNVSIVVPDSPSDPNHYGHVVWQCCLLLKCAEGMK